jgi:hypothetical protein
MLSSASGSSRFVGAVDFVGVVDFVDVVGVVDAVGMAREVSCDASSVRSFQSTSLKRCFEAETLFGVGKSAERIAPIEPPTARLSWARKPCPASDGSAEVSRRFTRFSSHTRL